jgi:hypothetical protein
MASEPASRPSPDFQRFQSLARRILTTPKAELVKGGKPKGAKPKGRGKK